MRVLVTGSSGFAGRWLLRHLGDAGDQALTWPDDLDIRDRDAVVRGVAASGCEGIVHLAAQASVAASWRDPSATLAVNVVGTAHVLEGALACQPRPRVVVVSSAEVYGHLEEADLPVGEHHAFAPASPYAASKAAAELVGVQAFLGGGLEVVRARPFNHTGPGQRPDFVVPSFARQIAQALREGSGRLLTGNLEVRRDLTDVRDVVRAYRSLLTAGRPGAVYNVCRGTSVSISWVLRRMLELAGADLEVVTDPGRVRPVDQPDLRGDPGALVAATGWRPQIDLDRTLGDVLDYWLSPAAPPGP
ncbi:MAG TPA: GDP-mannose 4,6-dehydratase [Acidimicrobiales bacterium]|nr:GDP-mannose 4,6-dehydratase [Acidimicrobiales bacterium]